MSLNSESIVQTNIINGTVSMKYAERETLRNAFVLVAIENFSRGNKLFMQLINLRKGNKK